MAERVLIDTDAFLLLAGAGLLESSLATLQCPLEEARILPALRPMLERNQRIKAKFAGNVIESAKVFAERISPIDRTPSASTLQLMSDIHDVDPGEALLYGLAAESPAIYVASNDKRAMRSIATVPSLSPIKNGVAGRIACLEVLVKALIRDQGARHVADRLAPVLHADIALQVIFTKHNIENPAECEGTLDRYVHDLEQSVGRGFLLHL